MDAVIGYICDESRRQVSWRLDFLGIGCDRVAPLTDVSLVSQLSSGESNHAERPSRRANHSIFSKQIGAVEPNGLPTQPNRRLLRSATADIVGTPYVADKLGCTTDWVANMARDGEIPISCVILGTGDGKPWKFRRTRIDEWISRR
jgi:hypothetical protein